jgi:hypothetical protein
MFLMNAVITVFNSLIVRGRSLYTADVATYRSLSAQRISESTVAYKKHGSTSHNSPVGRVITLSTGPPRNLGWRQDVSVLQAVKLTLEPHSIISNRYTGGGAFSLEYRGRGLKLTINIHLVLSLRIHQDTPRIFRALYLIKYL